MRAIVLTATALLVAAAPAGAKVHPAVAPATGKPSSTFKVGFKADRTLPSNAWYEVDVTSTSRRPGCEYWENAVISHARKGRPVGVRLSPVDKHRWCAGDYKGTVSLARRTPCGDSLDDYVCYDERVLGRFRLHVTAG